ncbi:MAG TPA: right-handed parallel beta-helix repeat-containing protein, partial [Candidatus Thermoplasmatota archaeon]|nr:right-handed parallel beta-helix repeat-containing protein [Candidatus Thermoplasmatota archaeon]
PFTPRGPIVIESDAAFTAANGVRSGTGSASDPFIIEGWSITTTGTAIRVHNVSANFTIRHNLLSAGVGIQVSATSSIGVVQNNQVIVRSQGIVVTNADADVVDNSLIGDASVSAQKRGVVLLNSNSRVESNAFVYIGYGIDAQRGSPIIRCNDIHDDVLVAGISVHSTTNATIDCNIITACQTAIVSFASIGTIIANNTIDTCDAGIDVRVTKDVTIANNSIKFSIRTQIFLDATSGNVTGNFIADGRTDAIIAVHSPVLIANNTISNHLRVGIELRNTGGVVSGNVISRNSVGIAFTQGSVVDLRANVLTNNTVGLDIPYASRQAFVNMSANVVNGINVDGKLNASQKVLFYKEANVHVNGVVIGQSNHYGALTAQGGIVFYEVVNANVNNSVIANQNIGVGVVNSFNVNVNSSVILNARTGIEAKVVGAGVQVPPCGIGVKDVNITIPIDPVATVGIDLGNGCFGVIARVNVSVVDIGIRVGGSAGVVLTNSTVFDTKIGADVQGSPNLVNVSGNTFVKNRVGVRLSGTSGVFADNRVQHNAEAGVRLENGASLAFERNNVSFNGQGLIDTEACAGPQSCSSLAARFNAFVGNRGDGARVNGHSTWRGDVALGNEGSGFVLLGGANLQLVNASGNEKDGARIHGDFFVDDSEFFDNDEDGLEIVGGGTLTDSLFIGNEGAGIRARPTAVSALRLNVSYNFDGIALAGATTDAGAPMLPPPSLPHLAPFLWNLPASGPTPFDIHRSVLMRNERDAIRGGESLVDATHNYFGRPMGPSINVADQVGAYQNGVTPNVRFLPYFQDPDMTMTGPVPFL